VLGPRSRQSYVLNQRLNSFLPRLVHPGFVHTGFGMENQPKREGQRDVGESSRGVIEAIDSTTLETTGTFYHGNYGEGVKTMPW
jgi:hypothetical protein